MIHKTTRSILSVLLAALLLVTSVPLTPAFADGGAFSPQSESAEGRALEQVDGVYQIYTADDLKEFADIVNGIADTPADKDANAKLMNDIDLNGSEENPWTPIGNEDHRYTGTFDGDGHTIRGLYINDSTADDQGLFGYVGTGGTVKDLTVSGSVKGDDYVGGVVGYNDEGRVENCHNIGSVSGERYVGGVVGYNSSIGNVKNCYNTGKVIGSGNSVGGVGGVVGYNRGSVENCHNTGTVTVTGTGTDYYVGGVVGYNGSSSTVENCYNTGKVSGPDSGNISGYSYVGGVVGLNRGTVENCYNTGTVSSNSNTSDVGGVVGCNGGTVDNGGTVENCYNTGKVTGISGNRYVGGVVGYNISSVTNCYFLKDTAGSGIGSGKPSEENVKSLTAEEFKNTDSFIDWDFGSDGIWETNTTLGRPVLTSNHEDDGSKDHPYEIFTATQLENFRDLVNGANGNPAAWAVLMNNIDLSSVCGAELSNGQSVSWEPIGNSIKQYRGTFDGNGKTIENLYINTTDSGADNQGLFGYVGTGGTVQNLSVSGSVSGHWFVGGVVGYNNGGTVTGCIFSGSGSGTGVTGSDYVGGIVGYNGTGATVSNCYNTGSVSGDWYVGGVVGWNFGGTVKNCYNIGDVSGKISVGGVVGWNDGANVTNCYFLKPADVNVGRPGIGGGSGTSSNVEARTADAFHSGEVAYLLQSKQTDESGLVWGQNLMKEPKDNYPQLRAFDADTPQVYKVAFMNDSEEHDAKYANSGMTVDLPATEPTKEGYTFSYWQDKAGTQVTEPITVTADTIYTAQWTPHTYSITASPSALDFGSITEGDALPAAQEVTITNTGNQTVTLVQPTAENFEIGALSKTELAPNAIATFTIQPKDNLPRGSYSEQIAISNTNGEKATITATFTVKEPPYTGKYSYEISTDIGDNGSLTVDRYATEGDKVTIDVTPDQAYKLDELVVTANGKDVELTANSDGTYTFTMPSADVRITATFAEDPDWTPDEPEEPTTDVSDIFLDVTPNAWYKDAIQYAYDNGLMTGVSDREFAPEQTTTRAMIVSILARLEGVESAEAAGFADVDDNDWYATAVNWAANVGVVNGYEDNTFQPNTAITREQLAAILMNYAAYKGEDVSNRADLTSYTDQPSTWAEETMSWAVAEGLITGVTADTLQPQGAATRAQVAAILQRFLSE